MPVTYDPFAPFYDLEYGRKEDDLPFYLDLADTYGSPILEIGAGTGRITFELARRGHEVWGIDNSPVMLRLAKNKLKQWPKKVQHNCRIFTADMTNFNLQKDFNLCIIPFRAFLHNLTTLDQLATLRCIHRHLQGNGILALDLFVPVHQVLGQMQWRLQIPAEEFAAVNQDLSLTAMIKHNPALQMLTIRNTYHRTGRKDIRATMKFRYIFRYEMELLLLASDFKLLKCTGGFNDEPYNFHSGIMCFKAQKI